MSFLSIILSLLLTLLWLHFLWKRRAFYKVAFQLPGPIGWPFIGLGLQMMHPDKYLQYIEKESKKYKSPFISWMGTKCFLYVNDPETVELVFNSPQCINKGDFYRFVSCAIGDGLFTSSVPRWNHHRRLINPAFNRNILNSFLTIFNAEANFLVEKLENSDCVEMFELLKRSVLETACQTTMGQKMNFHSNGSAAIFASYNGLTEACVRRMLSPWLYPDMIFKWSSLFKHQQAVVRVLFEFIENLLRYGTKTTDFDDDVHFSESSEQQKNHLKKASCSTATATNELSDYQRNVDGDVDTGISKSKAIFVEQVRNHVDQGQLMWSDVRDEANVIIAASFETTSTALYFVCLCLAIHPQYQDLLYDELIELFPPTSSDGDEDEHSTTHQQQHHNITKDHIDRMTYTEMVINEAMRLFSPVPMVLRRVAENELKLRDIAPASATAVAEVAVALPVGTQIGIDIFNMQRSELVWGPHAKDFRPELHFGPNAAKRHPFAFVPFTKGLRMCLGSRYAMLLMKVFIAKIFRNFRLRTNAKLTDLTIKGTISLKLAEYPTFQIERR